MKIKKRVYLDVCTLCRPFDDQNAMRIHLETNAYYLILRAVRQQIYQLVISPVHFQEVKAIGDVQERYEVLEILNRLGKHGEYQLSKIRKRAESLHTSGFGVADAAHVAFAESTADYFITCDDKLLKKCKKEHVSVEAFNPVEFTMEEDLR